MAKILDKQAKPIYTEARRGDVRHSYADVSKIEKELGIKPIVDFESGLQKTISFYQRKQLVRSSVQKQGG